jgi:hypothetical protein
MNRNNRKKRGNEGFILPAPIAGAIVLFSTVALAYVWLGCQSDALGKDMQEVEKQRLELAKKLDNEENRWSSLKAPPSLEKALSAHGITMTWPSSAQVIRLTEDDMRPASAGNSAAHILRFAQLDRGGRNE